MKVVEEIEKAARQTLAKHGMADHKVAIKIYEERNLNPHENTIRAVCEYYGVELADVLSTQRQHPLPLIRQVLCYLLYYESGLNHQTIAKLINRDRCTVIYSIKTILGYMRYDRELHGEIELLRASVNNYGT